MSQDTPAEPNLRHDPPDVPGYRLHDRPAIPINRLNLLSFPLAIPFGVMFYVIGALLQPGGEVIIRFSLWSLLLLAGIVLVAVPLVHEAVHGLVARALGANPFFGVGSGYAYTSFREPVTPAQYRWITVSPLLILSALGIFMFPLTPEWFVFILGFTVTNAAGSIGDIWILNRIRQLPEDALIYDLADGYAAFVPE